MNLNQVTVPTNNVEKAVAFYKQLGLKLIVSSPHYARFVCPDGDATFSVELTDEPLNSQRITVYFECENLDDYVQECITRGLIFSQLPSDQVWLWREAIIHDPDQNKIKLYYAGENRVNPPWRVKEEEPKT